MAGTGAPLVNEHGRNENHGYTLNRLLEPRPFAAWRSQCLALLRAAFGHNDTYTNSFEIDTVQKPINGLPTGLITAQTAEAGLGVLQAAADDHANGCSFTVRQRVYADVFDDFLEMAAHLLDGGYTTAAAVIAGTTLEEHARKLCQKHGVTTGKTAAATNEALYKQSVYSQADWRLNQGWLDIRNDCAHNLSTAYDKQQIRQMIEGIRGFMVRNPA